MKKRSLKDPRIKSQRGMICALLKECGVSHPWALSDTVRIHFAAAALDIPLPTSKVTKSRKLDWFKTVCDAIRAGKKGDPAAIKGLLPVIEKKLAVFNRKPIGSPKNDGHHPSRAEIKAFYEDWKWKRLSYQAKQKLGRRCMCCGATPENGAEIHTDHIKPIRRYWHMRFDPSNLQILCSECNQGKGSWDETNWHEASAA